MNGAEGVAYRAGGDGAVLERLIDRHFDIAYIVKRVEDTDYVDAVLNALLDEKAHDIVGVMLVAEEILTSEKHLELGIRAGRSDLAQPLPRILIEVTQAGVEGGSAPALE